MGIFTLSFIWLTLFSCSQVRGRLVMEKHGVLDAKKTVSSSEMEVNALNPNNRDEYFSYEPKGLISSELQPRSNESFPAEIPSSTNIYGPEDDPNVGIQHWAVYQSGSEKSKSFYGAKATLVVYGFPNMEVGQSSSAVIWVSNGADGPRNQLNVIQTGWQVFPELYGDNQTHFFTTWTVDGYNSTGCYNLQCDGFVLHNTSSIVPGMVVNPVSTVGGPLYEVTLQIFKGDSGDWWLHFGHDKNLNPVGYWPKSLFTSLANEATRVDFGGQVSFRNGVSPPMGSGYFPTDRKAAYFRDTNYINKDGVYFLPKNPAFYADQPNCYKLGGFDVDHFLYGGPGGCVN